MYVVCLEHVEVAIEEFVEDYEQSPDIYELGKVNFTNWISPKKCDFCDKESVYLIV